jgi:23S rRNA (adenine2030-N6)-methyltransferase
MASSKLIAGGRHANRRHPLMFSYRHGFHAGNHADVLKHTVLIQLLAYLNQKPTPYMVIDTHAGSGLYQLDS